MCHDAMVLFYRDSGFGVFFALDSLACAEDDRLEFSPAGSGRCYVLQMVFKAHFGIPVCETENG